MGRETAPSPQQPLHMGMHTKHEFAHTPAKGTLQPQHHTTQTIALNTKPCSA
jgi:hypothetical protein